MRQLDEEGRYRLGAADLLTSKRCVLEGAVPPIAITQEEPVRSYGWVSKGLPTPATGGLYVVEFFGKSDIAILAYIDPFGRVFSTSEASAVPPARTPDLTFARVPQQAAGEELGCVYVHESDGSKKDVAQYRCASGRYALFDSWYDFGPYDMNLTYEDAMARAYLAFVLRPSLGAPSVPERGIGGVFERLKGDKPLTAMRSIVEDARCAEDDPVCKPPALVSCLAHWLTEAGLDKLAGVKDEALRLVRTVRYANTYYLGVEDGEAPLTIETVWAIEAALNRFLLVSEAFGDRASMATEADCARWDAYLLETVAAQRPVMDGPADAGAFGRVDALRRGGGGGGVRSEGSGRVAHAVVGVAGGKRLGAGERARSGRAGASLRAASGAGAGCCCIRRFVWNPTRRHRGAAVRERGAELERRK